MTRDTGKRADANQLPKPFEEMLRCWPVATRRGLDWDELGLSTISRALADQAPTPASLLEAPSLIPEPGEPQAARWDRQRASKPSQAAPDEPLDFKALALASLEPDPEDALEVASAFERLLSAGSPAEALAELEVPRESQVRLVSPPPPTMERSAETARSAATREAADREADHRAAQGSAAATLVDAQPSRGWRPALGVAALLAAAAGAAWWWSSASSPFEPSQATLTAPPMALATAPQEVSEADQVAGGAVAAGAAAAGAETPSPEAHAAGVGAPPPAGAAEAELPVKHASRARPPQVSAPERGLGGPSEGRAPAPQALPTAGPDAPTEGAPTEPPDDPRLRPAASPENIPLEPSLGSALAAVGRVMGGARACVAGRESPTTATLVFGSAGRVTSVALAGDVVGTPTEACLRTALSSARVAPFAKPSYTVRVPVRP